MLISCDNSWLVIDTLCEHAMEGNAAVACFYFNFADQEQQSPAAVLGSVLKHIIGRLDKIPETIVQAFRRQKEVVGGQRLMLSEIENFLQDVTSSRPTFICIDALDECQAGHRAKLLDSLNRILKKSPEVRLFLTGRQHIRAEVERRLGERAASRSITPTKNDMITFLRAKLDDDEMPDAMEESLKEEIIQRLPETVSEM